MVRVAVVVVVIADEIEMLVGRRARSYIGARLGHLSAWAGRGKGVVGATRAC